MIYTQKVMLYLSPDEVREVCHRALEAQGWTVLEATAAYIIGTRSSVWRANFDFRLDFKILKSGFRVTVTVDSGPAQIVDPFGALSGPVGKLCDSIVEFNNELVDAHNEEVGQAQDQSEDVVNPTGPIKAFVSYAREDAKFAEKIVAELFLHGVQSWIDQHALRMGDIWPNQITQAIDEADVVLFIISPASVASEWVKKEMSQARRLKKSVMPLMYKHTELPSWVTRQFGSIQLGDFSKGSYREKTFELVDAIKEKFSEQATG